MSSFQIEKKQPKKPSGFVLDSNPSAGKGRKLSYFDVSSAAVWVRLGDWCQGGSKLWASRKGVSIFVPRWFWRKIIHWSMQLPVGFVLLRDHFLLVDIHDHTGFLRGLVKSSVSIGKLQYYYIVELWVRYCTRTCQESDLHCTIDTAESNISMAVWCI